ncbi:hypothetical protein EVAR_33480_1 [Eumeta japonica]|uniref:Uncharacterized protein n=1 Tax=Eumeta variegata TaxID=151549 RepID=A0A4C1WEB1_EUMVA|nr:hypothetical protein EVAR_33480_1 [Eumeta japonica]
MIFSNERIIKLPDTSQTFVSGATRNEALTFPFDSFVQIESTTGSGVGIENRTQNRIENGTRIGTESGIGIGIKIENETEVENGCGNEMRNKKRSLAIGYANAHASPKRPPGPAVAPARGQLSSVN